MLTMPRVRPTPAERSIRLFSLNAGARVARTRHPPHRIRSFPVGNSDPPSPRISRRTLLKAGVAGGAALLFARWLYTLDRAPATAHAGQRRARAGRAHRRRRNYPRLSRRRAAAAEPEASSARAATLNAVDRRSPGCHRRRARRSASCSALLAFPPTRCLIAGVWSPWPEATPRSDRLRFWSAGATAASCCCARRTPHCISSCFRRGTRIRGHGLRSATRARRRWSRADGG